MIPALNEARGIASTLAAIRAQLVAGDELLVVDGGSDDGTLEAARAAGGDELRVLSAARGRAAQMNAGAAAARAPWLLFLHADTLPEPGALAALRAALRRPQVTWGFFLVRLDSRRPSLRAVQAGITLRTRLLRSATGDQGLFVRASLFAELGGFPDEPLLEDVILVDRLRARGAPALVPARLRTSARRWERHGVLRTVLLMWTFRLAHRLGASPSRLAALYRDAR